MSLPSSLSSSTSFLSGPGPSDANSPRRNDFVFWQPGYGSTESYRDLLQCCIARTDMLLRHNGTADMVGKHAAARECNNGCSLWPSSRVRQAKELHCLNENVIHA